MSNLETLMTQLTAACEAWHNGFPANDVVKLCEDAVPTLIDEMVEMESRAKAAEANFNASVILLSKVREELTATRKQLAEAEALEPIAWAVYHGVWKVLTSKHVAEEYAKNNFGDVHPVLSDVPRTAALSTAITKAVEMEREACAKICDETWVEPGDMQVETCHEAAALIRARGMNDV